MIQDELTLLSASCQNDEAAARETEQSLRELQRLMDEARHAHNAANSTWTRAKEKDMEEGDEGAGLYLRLMKNCISVTTCEIALFHVSILVQYLCEPCSSV